MKHSVWIIILCYINIFTIRELRTLYTEYPELWQELKRLDKLSYRQFRSDYSVDELEQKFDQLIKELK